jgi:hypothetical protein
MRQRSNSQEQFRRSNAESSVNQDENAAGAVTEGGRSPTEGMAPAAALVSLGWNGVWRSRAA